MKPGDEIDNLLADAAKPDVSSDAARHAIARAQATILADLQPVHPLPAPWLLALAVLLVFAFAAAGSASLLGLHGLQSLDGIQRAIDYPALLLAAWLAADACVNAMRPASGRRLGKLAVVAPVTAFSVLFFLLFPDRSTGSFVLEGIPCLRAGMGVAIPTGLAVAWILRRGFVLDWGEAGLAGGSLAGLAGLAMLELHCANLKAPHRMVWHVAVIAVSAALGFAFGRLAERREAYRANGSKLEV